MKFQCLIKSPWGAIPEVGMPNRLPRPANENLIPSADRRMLHDLYKAIRQSSDYMTIVAYKLQNGKMTPAQAAENLDAFSISLDALCAGYRLGMGGGK